MKKYLVLSITFFVLCSVVKSARASFSEVFVPKKQNDITISNRYFSISVPENLRGLYETKTVKQGILIYDKQSKKAGFGGLAFGIHLFKNPSDHATLPGGKKVGEFEDKNGVVYDVVLHHPTDIQYDYVNQKSPSYDFLYNYTDAAVKKIVPKKKCKYYYQRGTKGENLYGDILNKHITAIKDKWDSAKLENENMSYMYNVLAVSHKNVLEKVGYTYYDVNGDGIDELFIGEIADGAWKGVIYDMYTMVNRTPAHVISGGSRDRYYVCDDFFVCNEYSGGADESGLLVYILTENSTELFPQVGFKYDGYTNKKNPWFISYDFTKNKWQNVSQNDYSQRKSTFEKYERFEYIPFSKLIQK